METFCGQFYALWFADWGVCDDPPNEAAVAIVEKAIEQVKCLPVAFNILAFCPDIYEKWAAMKAAVMLLEAGAYMADGSPVVVRPTSDKRYVKRDRVGYVEREYEPWEPQCDDCESGLASLKNYLAQIEDACGSVSAAIGGTDYNCLHIDGGCCGYSR